MAAEHTVRIGRRIQAQREKAGLTQAELAAAIPGKSDGTQVSKWERGVHRPSDDTLEHIAKALGCKVSDFHVDAPEDATSPDLMGALKGDRSQLDAIAALTADIAKAVALLLQTAQTGQGAEGEFEREIESAALLARLRGESTAAAAHKPRRRGKAPPAPPDTL